MIAPIMKVVLAAIIIVFASWLSHKKPEAAGFIIALPLMSILAILFSYMEYKDADTTITFAKSILVAVPISYLFFVPFFFTERFHLGFWGSYIVGLLLLTGGFFLHQWVMKKRSTAIMKAGSRQRMTCS